MRPRCCHFSLSTFLNFGSSLKTRIVGALDSRPFRVSEQSHPKKTNDDAIALILTMAEEEEDDEEHHEETTALRGGTNRRMMIRQEDRQGGGSPSSFSLTDSLQRLQRVRQLWGGHDDEDKRLQSLQRWNGSTSRLPLIALAAADAAAAEENDDDDATGTATGKTDAADDDDDDYSVKMKSDDDARAASSWGEQEAPTLSSSFWENKENVALSLLLASSSLLPSSSLARPSRNASTKVRRRRDELSSSLPKSPVLLKESSISPQHHHHAEIRTTATANTSCSLRRASPAAKNALFRLNRQVDTHKDDDDNKLLRILVAKFPLPLSSSSSSSCEANSDEEQDSFQYQKRTSRRIYQSFSSPSPSHGLFQLAHLIIGCSSSSRCYFDSPSRGGGENTIEKEEESNKQQQESDVASCYSAKKNTTNSSNHQMTKMSRHRLVQTTLGLLIFSVLTLWRLYCTGGSGSRNSSNGNMMSTTITTRSSSSTITTTTTYIVLFAKRLQRQALLCLPLPWIQRLKHVMMRALIHQAIALAHKVVLRNSNNNNSTSRLLQPQQPRPQVPFHNHSNDRTTGLTKSSLSCKEESSAADAVASCVVAPPSELSVPQLESQLSPTSPSSVLVLQDEGAIARRGFWKGSSKRLFGVYRTATTNQSVDTASSSSSSSFLATPTTAPMSAARCTRQRDDILFLFVNRRGEWY
jgi:hypothetical protein